jgi:carotenoid cleavage dioxygenase-like enzyme
LASGSSEPGWELFVTQSSAEDTALTCFSAPGLPSQVDGTYVVSGPARWQQGDYALQGLFDGFGKANKFRIGGGQVCHASKWMNTSIARAAEAKGFTPGMLFEESNPARPSCPLLQPMCEVNQLVDNNWVNIIEIGGRVVMLSDTPHMLEMDLDTLDVTGNFAWSDDKDSSTGPVMDWATTGHVVASGSAHPIPFAKSNTVVDIVTEVATVFGKSYLDVYTFQSDATGLQPRTRIAQLPFDKDKAPYLHSFGVTENYIVLPVSQKMGIPNMGHPVLLGAITMEWQGIYVLDQEGKTVGHFTEMDPFVHVHVINCFDVTDDSGTRVVIDLGAYPDTPFQKSGAMDIPMFLDKESRDANTGRATLQRITMYVTGDKAGQAEVAPFTTTAHSHADFYRMNPAWYGQDYCYFYATEWWHDSTNYANMAILKHNVCDDTATYWSKADFYPGEPFFIPTGGSDEDDGVLIFVAIDGQRGASSFITLDAKTMTEVDGASVNLPFHIPFTAHGEFIAKPTAELMV